MNKPTRYFVDWFDGERYAQLVVKYGGEDNVPEHAIITCQQITDFTDYKRAKKFAELMSMVVMERVGIADITPDDDPPGLLWDWEEREARAPAAPRAKMTRVGPRGGRGR